MSEEHPRKHIAILLPIDVDPADPGAADDVAERLKEFAKSLKTVVDCGKPMVYDDEDRYTDIDGWSLSNREIFRQRPGY
jgi:hypothetical protein